MNWLERFINHALKCAFHTFIYRDLAIKTNKMVLASTLGLVGSIEKVHLEYIHQSNKKGHQLMMSTSTMS